MMMPAAPIAIRFFVAPNGNDTAPGTQDHPFATIDRARTAVRTVHGEAPVIVILRGGTYRLPETVVFTPEDSGMAAARVTYEAFPGESPVLSGADRLPSLQWKPFRDGIYEAGVPDGFSTDQLFVNGQLQVLARYPNFDPKATYFGGVAADCLSPERVKRWTDPTGGYFHAMHAYLWGDMHWKITGKDAAGNVTLEGGWQNNRPAPPHPEFRFVENIFEELDAPHEWYLDTKRHTLYYYPPAGLDLSTALFEGVHLDHLIEFQGDAHHPVHHITLQGITFRHARRTFMQNREPMLLTDWTIYRGGAIVLNDTEDCRIVDCDLDHLGGNGIFVNNFNRHVTVRGCLLTELGANGIAFVGDPAAVRSPGSWKTLPRRPETTDLKTPGPKTENYPAECLVEDCLIFRTGRVEKQTAPIEIDMARDITVRHCSIYDVPRAGINIGDGCWGGHLIEFCDVFDTVKETGDHGSFNSWGRDRFWGMQGIDLNTVIQSERRALPLLDVVKPNTLRNNRWRCDHGWDIDLDDGSSNYRIYNNLCLHGGLKNREGYFRVVENNIMVDNGFHPHVWYTHCEDIFRHNIVFGLYQPAVMPPAPWGKIMDFNLMHLPHQATPVAAATLRTQSGRDERSLLADADFVDAAHGDYRVREGSPALALGFKNFPMDRFGVVSPRLRRLARTPFGPPAK